MRKRSRPKRRPQPPIAQARALGAAYGDRIDRWQDRAIELIADSWHANPHVQARTDAKDRPPSPWIASRMAALRADIATDLQHHAFPEIGLVAEKVERLATKATGAMLAGLGATDTARKLEGVSARAMLESQIDTFREENLSKIQSLASSEIDTLEGMLDDAEMSGMRVEELRGLIKDRFDVTKSKADLLARDQVLKLNSKITQARQTQSGISKYTWSTSGDERVREMHDDLDGTEQSWDDPPVTNEDGDTNHPGEDYQCRCVAIPILPDIADMPDETSEDDEG